MLNKIKYITLGIIIGASIIAIPTFADTVKTFVLTKATYPVVVNGEEYVNNELPVLNYEGSTYVPLRAVGDILDSDVEWNGELGRVEITKPDKNEPIKINKAFFKEDIYYQIMPNIT
jgi:hypothetical protein